jgi:biopolymer transport protein ExbD
MARSRKRTVLQAGELNLTAMIDVAFQLLSFFIVTLRPVDVLAHLDALSAAADTRTRARAAPLNVLRVKILPDGNYAVNDRPFTPDAFEGAIASLAALDKTTTVVITCPSKAPHRKLIWVLDLCQKVGFSQLSIASAAD